MVYIYVLKCKWGKYYVGKTTNPDFRIDGHFASCGARWTKIYKPEEVLELIPNCDHWDEDKYTKIYMDKFGIMNVRGGNYSQLALTRPTVDLLIREMKGANDNCFMCGEKGHFVVDCPCPPPEYTKSCYRCGRGNHFASECHARFHVNGGQLFRKNWSPPELGGPICHSCGRYGHSAPRCRQLRHAYPGPCSDNYHTSSSRLTPIGGSVAMVTPAAFTTPPKNTRSGADGGGGVVDLASSEPGGQLQMDVAAAFTTPPKNTRSGADGGGGVVDLASSEPGGQLQMDAAAPGAPADCVKVLGYANEVVVGGHTVSIPANEPLIASNSETSTSLAEMLSQWEREVCERGKVGVPDETVATDGSYFADYFSELMQSTDSSQMAAESAPATLEGSDYLEVSLAGAGHKRTFAEANAGVVGAELCQRCGRPSHYASDCHHSDESSIADPLSEFTQPTQSSQPECAQVDLLPSFAQSQPRLELIDFSLLPESQSPQVVSLLLSQSQD